MSKIGKKPIEILAGVEVDLRGSQIKIRGPLGESQFKLDPRLEAIKAGNQLSLSLKKSQKDKFAKALWGTTRAILANKITGAREGFQVDLILEGLGYTAEVAEGKMIFRLGYTHPVALALPPQMTVEAKAQKGFYLISVKGFDKEAVGQFAGLIRKLKPAEPYKGKGFRYVNEKIKRKVVKKLGK